MLISILLEASDVSAPKALRRSRSRNLPKLKKLIDKSNEVVILDRKDYDEAVEKTIAEGPYVEWKSRRKFPVDALQNEVKNQLDQLMKKGIIKSWEKNKLIVKNPSIPRLYALPKTHKTGNKMRPISSNTNAPTSLIGKYLTQWASTLKPQRNFSVKNSKELIQTLKEIKIEEDEEIVSFDVEALFPSVPTGEALECLNEWIDSQDMSDDDAEKFCELAKICLSQKVIRWREKFYEQKSGLSMGNSLSPIVANLFMGNLEINASKTRWFPRFWRRYVDDVFAVVKKNTADEILQHLNTLSPTIKFTLEKETDKKLPFLDLLIINNNGKIEFDIYRKPTHVPRYIPYASNHPHTHKIAAFQSMVQRMTNTPLSEERRLKETQKIKEIAEINDFSQKIIDDIISKEEKRKLREAMTTLKPLRRSLKSLTTKTGMTKQIFTELPMCEPINYKIEKILNRHNINVYYSSRGNLKSLLKSAKDSIDDEEKSGIYEISCVNCEKCYRGQTSRRIYERYKEHKCAWKNNNPSRSAMAQHCIEKKHNMGPSKLLKEISNQRLLDSWESILIDRGENLVNLDEPPIKSSLFVVASKARSKKATTKASV